MNLNSAVEKVELKAVHILWDEELVVGEVFLSGEDAIAVGVDQLHLLRLGPQCNGAQGVAAFVQQALNGREILVTLVQQILK
jgi:hypothetical protein